MIMARQHKKSYWEMTAAELAEATKSYDDPNYRPRVRKPSREEKTLHDKIMRRARVEVERKLKPRGRPKVGRGARRIMVTVERGLLSEADAEARRRQMSRSQLIAEGLKQVIRKAS
jgi:hypothetical protein